MLPGYLSLFIDLFTVVLCAVAAIVDCRTYRIPNPLVLIGVLSGLALNGTLFALIGGLPTGPLQGLLSSLIGLMFMGIVFGVLVFINFVGMGDLKLMLAVGALLRWPDALWAFTYVTIAGGIVALAFALGRGQAGRVFRNMWRLSQRAVGRQPEVSLHRIPYALAIFLGVAWTVASKHLPALRII